MSLRNVGAVKDTTTVTLYHPATNEDLLNADKSPMTVTVHGPYSNRYKKALRDQQHSRMTAIGRGRAKSATLSPEELDAFSEALLIECIEDWKITLEGDKTLPFSAETAAEVFKEFPWVREQISAAMGDVGDFLEPSKAS